jgi:hypothetical protein
LTAIVAHAARTCPACRRADGHRHFTTFNDVGASTLACSPGICFVALHAHLVWQAEFTAGIAVKVP